MPSTVSGKGDGYNFSVDELDAEGHAIPNSTWWKAPYFFDLPYADGYGWAAGDRIAYCLTYGFLVRGGTVTHLDPDKPYDWDIVGEEEKIGRFSAVLTQDAGAYLRINDHGMVEGRRFFDGSPGDGRHQLYSSGFCDDPEVLRDEYGPYTGPAQEPIIVFRDGFGEVAEIRPYPNVVYDPNVVIFALLDGDGSDGTVSVAAVDPTTDLIGPVVYYDALGNGSVSAHLP
jgi:hypothetical protein